MKRVLLVILATLMLSSGLAFGNAISVDDVVGKHGGGTIDTVLVNTPIKFWLRYQNTSGRALSIFNGYEFYSPNGATWSGPVSGDSLTGAGAPITKTSGNFDLIFGMTYFDGALRDTFVIQGQRISGPGLPIDYNNVPYGISIGSFDAAEHGMTICIDSAFGRPASTWKWTGSGGYTAFPTWGGPYCYTIFDPEHPQEVQLEASPTGFNYNVNEGSTTAINGQVNVISTPTSGVAFTVAKTQPWLTLNAAGGTTPQDIGFSVNPTGLAPAIYTDTLTISASGVTNSPLKVPVTLTVTAVAKFLGVDPATPIDVVTLEGVNPAPVAFAVFETGGFNIPFTVSDESPWLNPTIANGTTTQQVPVNIDVTGIPPGLYLDSVIFSSASADNSPVKGYVQLTITPDIKNLVINNPGVADDTLKFTGVAGGPNPAGQSFSVSEAGGAAIPFTLTEASTWIDLSAAGGTTPQSIDVSINTASVPPGTFFHNVEVASVDADNSPQLVTIMLTLTEPPKVLAADPLVLDFITTQGVNPASKQFNVFEEGGAAIAYSAAESSDWIDLSGAAGTTPAQVTVDVDVTGLAPNTYQTTITLTSVDASNTVNVTVNLTVVPCATITTNAPAYAATITEGESVNLVNTIMVTSTGSTEVEWTVGTLGAGWTVTPSSGTTPTEVIVEFSSVTPAPGSFQSCVVLNETGEGICNPNGTQFCIDVTVNALPCVDILLSASAFDFTATEGDAVSTPASRDMEVTSSDPNRNFLFTVHTSGLPADAWVKFSNGETGNSISGVTPTTVQVIADPTGLLPGLYTADCMVMTEYEDACTETSMRLITVTLNVFEAPSADTILVSTEVAVPGQAKSLPVSFVNSCGLDSLSAVIAFDATKLHLEAVSFAGSRIDYLANKAVVIDRIGGTVSIFAGVSGSEARVSSGSGLLANLEFVVRPDVPFGFIPVTVNADPTFWRNCGSTPETEIPEIVTGGLQVDEIENLVCGWVVDPDGVEIPGATVALYGQFPTDGPLATTTTSVIGSFFFQGVYPVPFDLYAYADGYYPNTKLDVNFGEKGFKITLTPLESLTLTSQWVRYRCDNNTLFGAPIPVGSVVEARTPAGLLVGQFVVTTAGLYGDMPVYAANAQFGDPGAAYPDVLRFYINGILATTTGDVVYPQEVFYQAVTVCLEAGLLQTKSCELQPGWNLISWNLDTPVDEIADVMASISDCIEVVLGFENGGLTYDPLLPQFSTLGHADHLSGYWVKIKQGCAATLEVSGVPVSTSTGIALNRGWNLVSYLPETPLATTTALSSLGSTLQAVYGYDNTTGMKVYIPGQSCGSSCLTEMASCSGYWLKVSAAGTLNYDGAGMPTVAANGSFGLMLAAKGQPTNVTPTSNWINLYSGNLTFNGQKVQAGATVTAHSLDGTLVGSAVMRNNGLFGFMPVYASNTGSGLASGGSFYLSVNGVRASESFTYGADGDRVEVGALTSAGAVGNLPEAYSLRQNYPNPFNPGTQISFTLPVSGQAKLEIYNVLGELVATPYDGVAEAGETVVTWNGLTANGRSAASGVYLYRLTSGSFSETKKMMLLK